MEILITVCVIALVLLLLYVLTRRQPRDAVSVPDVGGGPNVGGLSTVVLVRAAVVATEVVAVAAVAVDNRHGPGHGE